MMLQHTLMVGGFCPSSCLAKATQSLRRTHCARWRPLRPWLRRDMMMPSSGWGTHGEDHQHRGSGLRGASRERVFYVDKTGFVRDRWASGDVVTLVCRPRRFGKTLNLDTVRCFLSTIRGGTMVGGTSTDGIPPPKWFYCSLTRRTALMILPS